MAVSSEQLVVTAHVASAALWTGGTLLVQVLASRLGARVEPDDGDTVVGFIADAGWAQSRLLLPSAVLLAVTGGWLMQDADLAIADHWWLGGSIGLWAVAMFVALLMLTPETRMIAREAAEHGADAEQVQWRIHRWLMLQRGQLLLIAVALALMTIRPG